MAQVDVQLLALKLSTCRIYAQLSGSAAVLWITSAMTMNLPGPSAKRYFYVAK